MPGFTNKKSYNLKSGIHASITTYSSVPQRMNHEYLLNLSKVNQTATAYKNIDSYTAVH